MYDTNEIYHHGVSGMKWGKRNGPPYPLNAEGKASLAEQKKASKVTVGSTESSNDDSKKSLSAKSKEDYKMHKAYNKQRAHKAVKRDVALAMIGSGAVGTAVAGPMGGVAAMLTSGLATTAFSSAVHAGKNAISNSKYKKMLLSSQEIKEASKKGRNILEDEAYADKKAHEAAKRAGLDDGDNYKVYKRAMAGDKKSKEIVRSWESEKNKSTENSESGLISKTKQKEKPAKDYSKLNADEIKSAKEDAIRKGDIKEAYKNRQHYSDDELSKVKARYELNTEVKDIVDSDKRRGLDRINEISETMETINRLGNNVAVAASTFAKIYNVAAPLAEKRNNPKKQYDQIPTGNLAQYQNVGGGDKKKKNKKK